MFLGDDFSGLFVMRNYPVKLMSNVWKMSSAVKMHNTDTFMTTESTSKVNGHWPVKYAVANIKDRGRSVYRLSPQWYMLIPLLFCRLKGSSCIYTGHSS